MEHVRATAARQTHTHTHKRRIARMVFRPFLSLVPCVETVNQHLTGMNTQRHEQRQPITHILAHHNGRATYPIFCATHTPAKWRKKTLKFVLNSCVCVCARTHSFTHGILAQHMRTLTAEPSEARSRVGTMTAAVNVNQR